MILYKKAQLGKDGLYTDDKSITGNSTWNNMPTDVQEAYRARARVGYYSTLALTNKHGKEKMAGYLNDIRTGVDTYKADGALSNAQKAKFVAAGLSKADSDFEIGSDKYSTYLSQEQAENLTAAQNYLNRGSQGVAGTGDDSSAIGYRNFAAPMYDEMVSSKVYAPKGYDLSPGSQRKQDYYNMKFNPETGYSFNTRSEIVPASTVPNPATAPVMAPAAKRDGGILYTR